MSLRNKLRKCWACGYIVVSLLVISPLCPNCHRVIPDDPPENNYPVTTATSTRTLTISGSIVSLDTTTTTQPPTHWSG